MGLFDKMLNYFGYEKARAFVVPSSFSDHQAGVGRPTQQNYTKYLSQYTDAAWVFTCIQRIASQGAGVPIQLFKKSARGDKVESTEVMKHPIITLLDKVNPFLTGTDLIEITLSYEELTGNAYWLLDMFEGGHPTEIYPLRPDRIRIVPDTKEYIKAYKYQISETKWVTFKPEQIIHFKYFNSIDDYYGLSPLSAGRMAINTQTLGDEYNQNFYANSAQPRGALVSEKPIKSDNKKRIAAAWKQMHQGNRNAHRVAILEGGLDWKALGITQKDMDFIAQKKMTREDIMGVFGVPPAMVGVFEFANYANSKEQREIFWRNTMVPKLNKYTAVLNEFLVKPWDETLEARFDYSTVDALQTDVQVKADTDEVLTRSGIKTINEAREERGMPPVDWGNTWHRPLNTAAVDAPDETEPEERTVQPTDDEVQEKAERFKTWCMKAAEVKARTEAQQYIVKRTLAEGEKVDLAKERVQEILEQAEPVTLEDKHIDKPIPKPMPPDVVFHVLPKKESVLANIADSDKKKEIRNTKWFVYKALTDIWEAKFLTFLVKEFKIQQNETLLNLEDHGLKRGPSDIIQKQGEDEIIDRILFDKKKADKAMRKNGKPISEGALAANAKKEIAALGLGISFDLTNPAVQEWLTDKTFKFANEVNTTTQKKLRRELKEAIKAGEGIPQARVRVNRVFTDISEKWSGVIARTEIVSATNQGALSAYEQSEVVKEKEWIDSRDSKVREAHQIDGERVKLNARFSNGLRAPGDPTGAPANIIQCRCTLSGIVE